MDLVRPDRLAQLADRAFVDIVHAGKIETGPPCRQHTTSSAGARDPGGRCRSLCHDAVSLDPKSHGWRRIKRSLQPLQDKCRLEPLIKLPVAEDASGIDTSLAHQQLWVDCERIAQSADHELTVMPSRLGNHDTGLRPKLRNIAVPDPLLGRL